MPNAARRPKPAKRLAPLAAAILALTVLAGCSGSNPPGTPYGARKDFGHDGPVNGVQVHIYDTKGTSPEDWPDLDGVELTLLDNGAFGAFDDAAKQFHELTGATVKAEAGGDGVKALDLLRNGRGDYDVVYGLDNMLVGTAMSEGLLQPYKPALAPRIDPAYVFFPQPGDWPATPVDHGYIAINVDTRSPDLGGATIHDLNDLRHYADQFVTEKPTISTPGLGFLLSTIATYGDATKAGAPAGLYDWHAYWKDLLKGSDTRRNQAGQPYGCVAVVEDWKTAYEQHFSAGYGVGGEIGGAGDKAIVTSYTESPAVENYYSLLYTQAPNDHLAQVLLAPNATFHQIQTMAIAKDAKHLEAAQAWVEFTLTDFFQDLAAPKDGVYPVVPGIDYRSTYHSIDPAPGSFREARIPYDEINRNLKRWQDEWTQLYEQNACTRGL